ALRDVSLRKDDVVPLDPTDRDLVLLERQLPRLTALLREGEDDHAADAKPKSPGCPSSRVRSATGARLDRLAAWACSMRAGRGGAGHRGAPVLVGGEGRRGLAGGGGRREDRHDGVVKDGDHAEQR